MRMKSSALAQAHSRRLAIAATVIGLFVCIGIAATYRQVGISGAVPLALSFLILAVFWRWGMKRAAAWRVANPSTWHQSVPLSVFGGIKTFVFVVMLATFVMVATSVLFHLLRI